ncbi:hypothetical protein [Arthrobacter sp. HMWF013]|uniref:hypothetical protein n=1 Tax=Arthrobacter sp. HMWF013 TaxID=2056849 RepID=UPI000D363B96|nr:hypothetical protein [Arthrobacter sp. HMWF013]PTT69913.1 hypothetical protein DBR22_02545 [Arthrobacter sp. HMWF013]
MTTAPRLIVEFPGAPAPDAEAARTVVAAARAAAAVATARSVPLLLPETADGGGPGLDPSVLAGILAADLIAPHTSGTVRRPAGAPPRLIVAASSSRNAPYNLARRIQSLNRITCGQVGLFLRADGLDPVTSAAPSSPPTIADSHARLLAEYVEVLRRLWVSFPEEALVGDRDTGRFADPRSLVPASFAGEVYSVAGALNVPLPSAHRTLLLTDAVAAGPAVSVDGVIGPDSGGQEDAAAPNYLTVTWIPAGGGAPAGTSPEEVVVTGTVDAAARVLREASAGHVLLRVRAAASQLATLLEALFEALPAQHESRDFQAHVK